MDSRRLGRARLAARLLTLGSLRSTRLAACKVSDYSHMSEQMGRMEFYSEQQLNLKLVEHNSNLVNDATED